MTTTKFTREEMIIWIIESNIFGDFLSTEEMYREYLANESDEDLERIIEYYKKH